MSTCEPPQSSATINHHHHHYHRRHHHHRYRHRHQHRRHRRRRVSAAVSIATEHMRDGVTRAIRRGAHHGGGFSCWHTRAVGWAVSAAFTFLPKIEGYGGGGRPFSSVFSLRHLLFSFSTFLLLLSLLPLPLPLSYSLFFFFPLVSFLLILLSLCLRIFCLPPSVFVLCCLPASPLSLPVSIHVPLQNM